jgi:hypothetical protein
VCDAEAEINFAINWSQACRGLALDPVPTHERCSGAFGLLLGSDGGVDSVEGKEEAPSASASVVGATGATGASPRPEGLRYGKESL